MEYIVGAVIVLGLIFFIYHIKLKKLHADCTQMATINFPYWLSSYYSSSGDKKIFMARALIYQSAQIAPAYGVLSDREKYVMQEGSERFDAVEVVNFWLSNPLSYLIERLGKDAFDTVEARFAGLFILATLKPTDDPEENFNTFIERLNSSEKDIALIRQAGYKDKF